jgi:hypothetical protein
MNNFVKWLIGVMVFIMLIRFGFFILGMMIRFWYITIPVILYLYYTINKKIKILKGKAKKEDKPIDAEFTVIDEEE